MIRLLLLSLLTHSVLAQSQDCEKCLRDFSFTKPFVPDWPIEYVAIKKVNYEKNHHASFCKRPPEIVDTVVIHHSETPSSDTAEKINEYHLQRGTPEDPWYMIAYSYVINSPYSNQSTPQARVTEGRPMDLVGAHAGSNVFVPMDDVQKKMLEDGLVTCGKENTEFKPDPTLLKEDKVKANVTTIGLVVIGNYAPFSKDNPNGYPASNPRYPTKQTQDLVARMSCQLQKKYPRIKNIKWHNFYHPTSCPGTIRKYIEQIKILARKYGCEFT